MGMEWIHLRWASEGRFYVIDHLGSGDAGLGAAERSLLSNPVIYRHWETGTAMGSTHRDSAVTPMGSSTYAHPIQKG